MKDFVKIWLDSIPPLPDFYAGILCFLVLIARIFEGWKYQTQSNKILRVQSAKSQSRMFINIALLCDIIIISYLMLVVKDSLLFVTGIFAFLLIVVLFFVTYIYYPYNKRGLKNFKRPNLWVYLVNSWTPNSRRKHL